MVAFLALAGCGPSPQPAATAPAAPPPAAPAAAPVAAEPAPPAVASAPDRDEAKIRREQRKLDDLRHEQDELRARNQAAQNEQYAPPPPPAYSPEEQRREGEREQDHRRREEAEMRERDRAAANVPYAAPPPPRCRDCGVVAGIRPVSREGQAGLVGTLGGAAVGGLAGNQFGRGQGNVAMTAIGVVGGALAGREVEKRVNSTTVYQVTVNMDSGGTRELAIDSAGGLAIGARVRVEGGNLVPL
jgi:outer membrane lipoprotein SlyB